MELQAGVNSHHLLNTLMLKQSSGISLLQGFLSQLAAKGWIDSGDFVEWQKHWFTLKVDYATGVVKLKWNNDSPTHFVRFLQALKDAEIIDTVYYTAKKEIAEWSVTAFEFTTEFTVKQIVSAHGNVDGKLCEYFPYNSKEGKLSVVKSSSEGRPTRTNN